MDTVSLKPAKYKTKPMIYKKTKGMAIICRSFFDENIVLLTQSSKSMKKTATISKEVKISQIWFREGK